MKVVVWARVSSEEQKEGYSIDAQLRAVRDRAAKEGWTITKEFAVAESAKKGASRAEFNKMIDWVRDNARKDGIAGILSHKLDRACRNIRDAVRLQDLESLGVRLYFVDNQFGEGAAGQLSFNVLASVSQFYSDNLREETLKGLNEKVQQGWLPTHAPYGYQNDPTDPAEPIKVNLGNSRAVVRIFQLFALGDMTQDGVADRVAEEGYVYQPSNPRFGRKTISYILNNPFYVGDIHWHGRRFPGKHKPIIDRGTYDACQDLLSGRNRRIRQVNLPLAGGLFRCRHCGYGITGEEIKKRQSDGSVKLHVYYRCSNNDMPAGHPKVRWRASDLEQAIVDQLNALRLPSPEVTEWFRTALRAALSDEETYRNRVRRSLQKREAELEKKKTRLLDTYLAGDVDKETFQAMNEGAKAELVRVREEMRSEAKVNAEFADMATAIFDMTQNAAKTWLSSNSNIRRELLDVLSLNRVLDETSLCLDWRKPFDALVEASKIEYGVAERT